MARFEVIHDVVIKWKHFPQYWLFARGIHRSWWIPRTKASHAELLSSMICPRINCWVNNRKAGDLRRHRAHYDTTVMSYISVLAAQSRLTMPLVVFCSHQRIICLFVARPKLTLETPRDFTRSRGHYAWHHITSDNIFKIFYIHWMFHEKVSHYICRQPSTVARWYICKHMAVLWSPL